MHGWIGNVLRVNLTAGTVSREPLDPALARDYIGARGLGTKVLSDEVDPRVDPLAPENKLLFVSGPLTGTYAPSGGRYEVVTKGALTGAVAAANSGMHASKSRANRPRAKTLSSSAIVSPAICSGPAMARSRSASSFKMRKISAASSSANCTS